MPRIRSIKPEIWNSADFMALDGCGQLAFIAMMTLADDEGRLHTDPNHLRLVALRTFSVKAIDTQLERMADLGMIARYEVGGSQYVALLHWDEHQKVDHKKPSSVPPPEDGAPIRADSREIAPIREDSIPRARPRTGSDQTGPDQIRPEGIGPIWPAEADRRSGSEVGRIWDAWVDATGSTRAVLSSARRDLIRRQLRSYSADDLVLAVRGWRHFAHNRGENSTGKPFNNIDLCLRDAEHIEKFRDAELSPPISGVKVSPAIEQARRFDEMAIALRAQGL